MVDDMRYMNIPPRNIRRRRLLVFIPIILLLIILYIIGYRATALRRDTNRFADTTGAIARESSFMGKQFRVALNTDTKNKYLAETVDNLVEQALSLSQRAEAIEPPEELKLAHSFFVVAMKLRHQGLEKYSRRVLTAFSAIQSNNAQRLSLDDMALSDAAYRYFLQETRRYLSSNNLKVNLTKSYIMTAKVKKPVKKIAEKKKPDEKNSEEESDIYVIDVATDPLRISYNPENDIRVLPDSNSVDVRVEVGNKGKTDVEDIPVEVELLNDEKFIERKSDSVSKILPGKKRKITIEGFEPKNEGVNVFKIKVGPLSSEKNKEDNNYSYKFIFKSQD